MSWFATRLISGLLLPPMSPLLLGFAGLALARRHPTAGKSLIISSLFLLYGFSTPYFAEAALGLLEDTSWTPIKARPADAIIILGGGTYFNAPEYGVDTTGRFTLERLRHGADLYRKTGKPILVAGGRPRGNATSEASQMKAVLTESFGVPVAWMEEGSENTRQNALNSTEILRKAGIGSVYLVTHAWHMPRARSEFERFGLAVIPAPTGFTTRYKVDWLAFIPDAEALLQSRVFLHEVIGLLWYRLR